MLCSIYDNHHCSCIHCTQENPDYQRNLLESMRKFGWYLHYSHFDDNAPMGANFHTHGLPETFGCMDLQLVIQMPTVYAHGLIINAVELIKKGTIFFADDVSEYIDIMRADYKVKFVPRQDENRTVYRMILPNPEYKYDGGVYSTQYK